MMNDWSVGMMNDWSVGMMKKGLIVFYVLLIAGVVAAASKPSEDGAK
jgi:hypothetical protein